MASTEQGAPSLRTEVSWAAKAGCASLLTGLAVLGFIAFAVVFSFAVTGYWGNEWPHPGSDAAAIGVFTAAVSGAAFFAWRAVNRDERKSR